MSIPFRVLALLLCAAGSMINVQAQTVADPIRSDGIAPRIAACVACHGREQAASNADYFPRLAGKPEGYLFNQLRSFRDGRRFQSDMTHLVQHMPDAYLHEIAAYFAALDLPYPKPSATSDVSAQTLALGKKLVFEGDASRKIPACVACHGAALTGVQPGIPALIGLPRLYVSSQLGAWLTNERHALAPDCMAQVGRRLSAPDISAVASWLALQPMPANPKPVTALPQSLPMPCSGAPNAG